MVTLATKILVVENEAASRRATTRMLVAEGFTVASAVDGPTALELATTFVPDVVVTDVVMPEVDGLSLLLRMKAKRLEMPLIVLTAVNDVGRALRAIRAGAADYLTKPVDADALVFAIERALHTRDVHRDAALLKASNESLALEAERNLRAREDLLAIVAHDLRGPLSTITLAARAPTSAYDHGDADRRLKTIRNAAKHMARLIEDLLEVARIETGGLVLDLAPHHASALVHEVETMLEPVANVAGVRLCATVDDDFVVHCAFERLVQVLANLVSNALDVTARGRSVRLRAEPRGDHAWFAVEDDGPGIPHEHLARVFDRGWHIDIGKRSGVGLGLAIAKGIVEAHGGSLGVESEIGTGSTFAFEMPLRGPDRISWCVSSAPPPATPSSPAA